MPDTGDIFRKIIAGEIPCHKVYEDEHVFAFLDINPLSRGHTLVVPRRRADRLDLMHEDDAAAVGRTLPRISRAVLAATGARDFNLLQNNGVGAHQAVAWVHFHIIPVDLNGSALPLHWPARKLDPSDGAKLAESFRAALQ